MLLSTLLKEQNINQVLLSKSLGVSVSYISKLVNGKRPITLNLARKLHNKYNIDYETLLGVNANEK
jgi:plasmid maintenance system antidote protein VapI|tara:strand:+ start:76 stop:273 length:198 start_codon:yes stop_codon:yes gene_type:complete